MICEVCSSCNYTEIGIIKNVWKSDKKVYQCNNCKLYFIDLPSDEEIYSNMNFQIYVNLNDEFEYTNEELFAGYMQQIMYPQLAISTYGSFGESQLNVNELEYYQSLKYQIEEVAQSGGSTKMSLKYNGEMTQESVQAELRSVGNVLSYLLNDCPYSLYWFDKTIGMSLSLNPFARIITFSMPVSADYAVENEAYQVDTEKIQRANAVPIAAKKIVDKYADKSDYEKLLDFLKENLQYNVELFQEILQKEIGDEENLLLASATLYFSKQGIQHAKNGERAKRKGRPEKEIKNIHKKMMYCSLAVAALGDHFKERLGISLEDV